jgi:PAS domain S-box-containing protein
MKVKIPSTKKPVQRIVFAYAFFSSLWILLSDQLVARLTASPSAVAHISTLKGWAFVLLTSGLLYILLRQYWRSLWESHYMLHSIIEGTTDAVFVKDLQGRYVMANSACVRVFGRSVEDVLGKDDTELFSPEIGRQVMANDQGVMGTGESCCLEETAPINGSTLTYLSVKTPYRNHRGEVAGLIGIARDISLRKQMELALRETTQTLEALVQASPLAIALLTPEGKVKLWNPAAEWIFGWSASEALGQPMPVVPAERQEEFAALRQRVLSGESLTGVELRRMRHDGSPIDISLSTAPLVDEQGQVYAIVSILADITVQKQAAAEIQRLNAELEQRAIESETRYQQIVELAEEGIWVVDQDRKTLYVNQAMTRILGYSEVEMYGRPITDFVQSTAEQSTLFDSDAAQRSEVRLLAKTGEERWVYFSTSPAIAPDGSLLWCCALVYDITDRKQSEQALRESEERFRLLVEQVKDYAIFLLDAEGKVASWNLGSERIKGYPANEIIGQHFSCFYPREDVQQGKPARELAIATAEGQCEDEGWRIRKDGSRFWADVVLTALRDETGQLRGFSKVTRDITQRKQVQEQLQQSSERISLANAELARATRLKDEFLANMSHELRTPLNAILGLSEALLEEVYGTLTDKQRKSLVTIEQSGNHLLELINDILDLSKIESGKMELQVELTNLAQVCDSSLTFIKQQAHKKQIKLGSRISPDLGEIELDKRRIHQVLINLLSNAVKFTPERGEVWIEAWGDGGNETIHLCVIDTGIGIAPENISKLFQPFIQLDSSLSRRHAGTGLGLALVRRIVELHGGSVSLESAVGKGSRFTITLPWKTGRQPIDISQE